MKILVIGGSLFLGKCFVGLAAEHQNVTVFNRGSRPLRDSRVREVVGDRKDPAALRSLAGEHFDAVVDTCAYQKGDIAQVFEALSECFDQYIFISTTDVYERGRSGLLDESAPLEERNFGGEAGDYITGKVALEKELEVCAKQYAKACVSLRPAFLYGPENYAPREGMYFHWIRTAGQILHPTDATGCFQMVYVEDAARAILACVEAPGQGLSIYNLAPKTLETYESFAEALKQSVDTPFECIPVTVETVLAKNIPLPFPLTAEESHTYDGKKALRLIGAYTGLAEGLRQTFD